MHPRCHQHLKRHQAARQDCTRSPCHQSCNNAAAPSQAPQTAPQTACRICASTPTTPGLWGARTPTTFSYPGKIKRREDLGTRNFKARNRCEACPLFSSKNFASKAFPPSLSMACSTGPVSSPSAVSEVPRTAEISLRICGPSSHCKNIRAVSTMWGCSALCCWTLDPFPPHYYIKRRI